MLHPAGQVAALGHEQREVEEARVAVGGPRARLLDEVQELAAARAEAGLAAAEPEQIEPDRLGVVGERPRQVGHGEVDGADGRGGGDRHQATTRYTWNTSAYSRFTLMPCVRATFQTYSAFA